MLIKDNLKSKLFTDIEILFNNQRTSMKENDTPEAIIKNVADELSTVIADAIEAYVKSGDIIITSSNIFVTSSTGVCTVVPVNPAKLQ